MKFFHTIAIAALASFAICTPSEAQSLFNDEQRVEFGTQCTTAIDKFAHNYQYILDNEAKYRPLNKIDELKSASAPGMRARLEMEQNCASELVSIFDESTREMAANERGWNFQLYVWYYSQPEMVKQGLVAPYF